jgi:hypothetical protein
MKRIDFKNERPNGCLWTKSKEKVNREGVAYISRYMTGNITIGGKEYKAIVFANRNKTERQPDWNMWVYELEDEQAPNPNPNYNTHDNEEPPF